MSKITKDLTKEAPHSPRVRTNGYVILARMTDKGRATLKGTAGEYHFNCPLDNMLFGFKGIKGEDIKEQLASGADDQQIASWIDSHGTPKTDAEKKEWSDTIENLHLHENPDKKDWFAGECAKLGLQPEVTSFFDFLEADDLATFKK